MNNFLMRALGGRKEGKQHCNSGNQQPRNLLVEESIKYLN